MPPTEMHLPRFLYSLELEAKQRTPGNKWALGGPRAIPKPRLDSREHLARLAPAGRKDHFLLERFVHNMGDGDRHETIKHIDFTMLLSCTENLQVVHQPYWSTESANGAKPLKLELPSSNYDGAQWEISSRVMSNTGGRSRRSDLVTQPHVADSVVHLSCEPYDMSMNCEIRKK